MSDVLSPNNLCEEVLSSLTRDFFKVVHFMLQDRRLSKAEIARRCDMTDRRWHRLEKGDTPFKYEDLVKIGSALDMNPALLLLIAHAPIDRDLKAKAAYHPDLVERLFYDLLSMEARDWLSLSEHVADLKRLREGPVFASVSGDDIT